MKNFNEFIDAVVCEVKKIYTDCEVNVQTVVKNNDVKFKGLTVLSKDTNMAPTIYLDLYYNKYRKGNPFDLILNEIVDVYESNKQTVNMDVSVFTEFKNVKDKIFFKLINYKKNEELLKETPHLQKLDLAIVFSVLLGNGESEATVLIKNSHLALWNKSVDDIYELAKCNTPKIFEYEIQNILQVLKEILLDEKDLGYYLPMYVLTNKQRLHGAGCMIYDNVLRQFADTHDCNVVIIPSSIHEVILIPDSGKIESLEEWSEMVHDVNDSQLEPEDILADHIYYYDRQTGEISC